jgi:hypothetical protein
MPHCGTNQTFASRKEEDPYENSFSAFQITLALELIEGPKSMLEF